MEQLTQLQKTALETGDTAELTKFCSSPEYLALPYEIKNKGFVTSHKLKEFVRCGFCYQQKYINGLADPTREDGDADALIIGQAFDDLMTYGFNEYTRKYEVVARRSKGAEKVQLTETMGELIDNMYREFQAQKLFNHTPNKKVFVAVASGLLLKAECDDADEEKKIIRDIKSAASVERFDPQDYLQQMAFYRLLSELVTGEPWTIQIEVADKYKHFARSAAYLYTSETLQPEVGRIMEQLDQFKLAHEVGYFAPAKDQEVLYSCPYYGVDGHGRPSSFIIF